MSLDCIDIFIVLVMIRSGTTRMNDEREEEKNMILFFELK